jgi:hypothetical protein
VDFGPTFPFPHSDETITWGKFHQIVESRGKMFSF